MQLPAWKRSWLICAPADLQTADIPYQNWRHPQCIVICTAATDAFLTQTVHCGMAGSTHHNSLLTQQHELKVISRSIALPAKAVGLQRDNREFWIIIENSVLKSMRLDYIDVDISFIYKAQLKNWPLHRSQVSVSLWSSQLSMPELNIANMQKKKYPLLKCSAAHLQSLFSIRQNNTQPLKRLSMKCQLRVGSQSTLMPASYQLPPEHISPHHWLRHLPLLLSITNLSHCLHALQKQSWADGYLGQKAG